MERRLPEEVKREQIGKRYGHYGDGSVSLPSFM